jgi:hypothetical protein
MTFDVNAAASATDVNAQRFADGQVEVAFDLGAVGAAGASILKGQ